MSSFVLYSDFNCPFCYALGERLNGLGAGEQVEWRGVQHAPHLPIPIAAAGLVLKQELEHEVAAIRQIAPEVEIALPVGKPNTRPAILAVAAAQAVAPALAHRFKDSIYRAFWTRGLDISNEKVLADLAEQAGLQRDLDTSAAESRVEGWQHEWEQTRMGGVPTLLRDDRRALVGLRSSADLAAFLGKSL